MFKAIPIILTDEELQSLTNWEKLKLATQLLGSVSEHWNDDQIETYESKFSFDELVAEVQAVELKNDSPRTFGVKLYKVKR